MKVVGSLYGSLAAIPESVRALERQGFDAAYAVEINNDPFLPALLAAEHSERIGITTAIAVAFARNPMTLAQTAWDLNQYARGRFVLGIGSQVQGHITRRFGMPWSQPAPRMREFVRAMQAIWRCWAEGAPLDFEGEFYRHTLMTPTFNPGPNPFGPPPVYIGALGPRLTRAAAEVADGLLVMPFSSTRFLAEATMPAVRAGLAAAGRGPGDFAVVPEVIVSAGEDHRAARRLLAFYGSTPAYRPVLDCHGWGELQPQLNALSKQGRWAEMGDLISDDMLHAIAACGTPKQIADHIRARVAATGETADTVCLYQPGPIGTETLAGIIDELG